MCCHSMTRSIVSLQRMPCAELRQRENPSATSRRLSEDHCENMDSWPQSKHASWVECYRCGCIVCDARQLTQLTRYGAILHANKEVISYSPWRIRPGDLTGAGHVRAIVGGILTQKVLSRNGAVCKHIGVPSWVRRCIWPCVPLERCRSFLASPMNEEPDREAA